MLERSPPWSEEQVRRQRPWDVAVAAPLPPHAGFTAAEHWAWSKIVRGEPADMRLAPYDRKDGFGEDAADGESWPAARALSERFLRTILFHEPWAGALDGPRVTIKHARIEGDVDWSGRETVNEVLFDDCLFTGRLRWLGGRVRGTLRLDGCDLREGLEATGLIVERNLILRRCFVRKPFKLVGVKVGAALQLREARIDSAIDLTAAEIAGEVHLAKEAGSGPIWGENGRLILRNAQIGALAGGIDSVRRVDGRKTRFAPFELSGLRFDRLGGFGPGDKDSSLAFASSSQLIGWLRACRAKTHFDPQPYRMMARALREEGFANKAGDVLNALGNYELTGKGAPVLRRFLVLPLSWLLIGYGYRNHRALFWFAALAAGGAALGVRLDPATPSLGGVLDWAGFSLGNSIPLLMLDERHAGFLAARFENGVPLGLTGLFYAAKIAGFVILSYLAAGLSGLASKTN